MSKAIASVSESASIAADQWDLPAIPTPKRTGFLSAPSGSETICWKGGLIGTLRAIFLLRYLAEEVIGSRRDGQFDRRMQSNPRKQRSIELINRRWPAHVRWKMNS